LGGDFGANRLVARGFPAREHLGKMSPEKTVHVIAQRNGFRLAQAGRGGRNVDELEGRKLGESRQLAPQVCSEGSASFKPRIDVAEGQL
jgi:hypothetical protein